MGAVEAAGTPGGMEPGRESLVAWASDMRDKRPQRKASPGLADARSAKRTSSSHRLAFW